MLIFRVTQKLATKLKIAPTSALPRADDPLTDWTANLFVADRSQYIIVTNSATLYSVIFPGRGITKPEHFIERTYEALVRQMIQDGCGALFKERIIPAGNEVVFSKTGDRKVMGSINDLVRCAKAHIEYGEDTPEETTAKLIETPMGALKYAYPREEMRALADPPPAPPWPDNVIPFRRKT